MSKYTKDEVMNMVNERLLPYESLKGTIDRVKVTFSDHSIIYTFKDDVLVASLRTDK